MSQRDVRGWGGLGWAAAQAGTSSLYNVDDQYCCGRATSWRAHKRFTGATGAKPCRAHLSSARPQCPDVPDQQGLAARQRRNPAGRSAELPVRLCARLLLCAQLRNVHVLAVTPARRAPRQSCLTPPPLLWRWRVRAVGHFAQQCPSGPPHSGLIVLASWTVVRGRAQHQHKRSEPGPDALTRKRHTASLTGRCESVALIAR